MSTQTWPRIDRSPLLLRDGYRFAERRRTGPGEDATLTRLAGSRAVVVRGPRAVEHFYTDPALERSSAAPQPVMHPLFGPGAVHGLDGEAHASRKAWFNEVLDAGTVHDLMERVHGRWLGEVDSWTGDVDVFERASRVLLQAVTEWAGFVVPTSDVERRRQDMIAMVDGFGSFGPRYLRARRARRRTQEWVRTLVENARRHGATGVLREVAELRDEHDELLTAEVAATELINLVRPTVAVSWLVAQGARALADSPRVVAGLRSGDLSPWWLAHEVRRTAPFVPLLAARATQDTHLDDVDVPAGTLVVLDVWGTNHDPRVWEHPDDFDPWRFESEEITPYDLVPQGGHVREDGHRCPGEDLTTGLLVVMLPPLGEVGYAVTHGRDPGLRRMPPTPRCDVLVTRGDHAVPLHRVTRRGEDAP